MFLVAALVTASLANPVVSLVAGQAKVQIIRGGKKTKSATVPVVVERQAVDGQQAADLAKKSADLDAKGNELDAKGRALDAKEADLKAREATAAEEKKQRDEGLRKKLEKLGEENRRTWQDATNSLAGD